MTDAKIWQLPAHEVVSLLRSGEVSPLEVVQASIDRIEEVDPKVNAIPIRCFDRAIEKAKKMNIKAEIKNPKSLLGLPIVVKDYNDLAGVKTTYGSKIFKDNISIMSVSNFRMKLYSIYIFFFIFYNCHCRLIRRGNF